MTPTGNRQPCISPVTIQLPGAVVQRRPAIQACRHTFSLFTGACSVAHSAACELQIGCSRPSALDRRRTPLDHPEDTLARTERRVRDGKASVARQVIIVEMLEKAGHARETKEAKNLLLTLQNALDLVRELLRIEREVRGVHLVGNH